MPRTEASSRYVSPKDFYRRVKTRVPGLGGWGWLLPMGSIYVAFLLFPIGLLFAMSFFAGIRTREFEFVGLQHYRTLLTQEAFYSVLGNTLYYTVLNTTFTVGGGLVLAVAIRQTYSRLRTVFQISLLLPYAIMSVGVALIWQIIYRPRTGVLTAVFDRLGMEPGILWLGDAALVLPSVAISGIWWTLGFYTVIWTVGLGSIDQRYYEAARMNGANSLQIFRYVTLPLVKPIGLFLLMISIITSLRVFGLVWILTRGGPAGASEVIVTWMYKIGFIRNELGLAAALGVILFLITLVVSVFNIRVLGFGGEQRE
jgi:ABC-type sugar transport system permease subunit